MEKDLPKLGKLFTLSTTSTNSQTRKEVNFHPGDELLKTISAKVFLFLSKRGMQEFFRINQNSSARP